MWDYDDEDLLEYRDELYSEWLTLGVMVRQMNSLRDARGLKQVPCLSEGATFEDEEVPDVPDLVADIQRRMECIRNGSYQLDERESFESRLRTIGERIENLRSGFLATRGGSHGEED